MSQMLKSSGAMAVATMTSRVLGMVREIVYAWFMGAGVVAGAFVLAFQIPNLFRRLLGEGALTAAFIPIFKEKERTSSPAEMWRAAASLACGHSPKRRRPARRTAHRKIRAGGSRLPGICPAPRGWRVIGIRLVL